MAGKQQDKRLKIRITMIVALALLFISYMQYGPVGRIIDQSLRYLFGQYHFVMYFILSGLAVYLIRYLNFKKITRRRTVGLILLFLAFLITSNMVAALDVVGIASIKYFFSQSKEIFNGSVSAYGGFFGIILYGFLTQLFALPGTYVIVFLLIVLGFLMTFNIRKIYRSFLKIIGAIKNILLFLGRKIKNIKSLFVVEEDKLDDTDITEFLPQQKEQRNDFIDLQSSKPQTHKKEVTKEEDNKNNTSNLDSSLKLPEGDSDYRLPPLTLLDQTSSKTGTNVNQTAAEKKGEHLIKILAEFNIPASLTETHIGPSVTKFEIRPDSSVKVSRISSIEDNIKMELSATDIRIEAPVPGKNTVGIEIPNVETSPVKMHELISQIPKKYNKQPLLFTLGKDLAGKTVYSDLTKLPHLLVAGATGSGKSVCINSIITTILLRTTPEQVKLVLIDPKKVEFTHFANVPHLESPVVTDPMEAAVALNRIVAKMDNRYEVFASIGVRNISGYYEYLRAHPDEELPDMPLIVVIIDELADLMIAAGKEVEMSIQRITQLARAAGIHLIVATQRPSTDVITGVIKANIPSRISFAVSSGIDSRTILDTGGAESLLGNGDMLYLPVGESAPIRLQGVYVSDQEIKKVTDFVSQQMEPEFDEAFEDLSAKKTDESGAPVLPKDEMYDDVRLWVIREEKASTSLLQRTFGIGYNRAARMIDDLEEEGIIGPQNGSRPREVLITEAELNEHLEEEKKE